MNRRLMMVLGLLFGALLLFGCGPSWQVVTQAVPNPMLGKNGFAVLPIDFTGLRVGDTTEAEWMGQKDQETRASWDGDKKGMTEKFQAELISQAGGEGIQVAPGPAQSSFVVATKITWVEPGVYTGFVNLPSEVEMTVRITTPDGTAVDEIMLKTRVDASMIDAASGARLRHCAENLGAIVAEYLKTRVKPEA
jgi:hypothetical protein